MASKNSIQGQVMEALPISAGVLSADVVETQAMNFLPSSVSKFSNAVPVVAGLFLAKQKGMVGQLGKGMIIGGVTNIVRGFLPTGAGGVNGYEPIISGSEAGETLSGDVISGTDYDEVYSDETEF